jgi:putative mRNA 3-end processing factor
MTDTLNPILPNPRAWLYPTPRGLYCEPGDFYVDPAVAVDRAVITHGHGDHARPGHRSALATPETLAIMRARFQDMPDTSQQPLK